MLAFVVRGQRGEMGVDGGGKGGPEEGGGGGGEGEGPDGKNELSESAVCV